MRFVVTRSNWLRGEGGEVSKLLRSSDSKMCCLGFRARACGIPNEALEGMDMPSNIPQGLLSNLWGDLVSGSENTDFCIGLAETNDCTMIQDSARESDLRVQFASIGDEIVFED